jgi:hypothetical protein
MAYICLQSINFLDRFMRLWSANFPLHVFRHQDFRLKLHEFINRGLIPPRSPPPPETPEEQLLREDSSFFLVPGLADSNLISFRSFNFPSYLSPAVCHV